MEDIDNALSTLQEMIRCIDLDEVQKLMRKFEDLAGSTSKESLNLERMPSIYQLNEETKALVQKVEKLYSRGKFSKRIAHDVFDDVRGDILPTPKLAGKTTAIKNMEKILEMINGDVRKIGVYGMGGIGKTTVMKHINNRILKEQTNKFDCVIWVTVSKESSVFKLQDDIARNLNVDLSNYKDTTRRAGALFKALKQKKRYLLILDDLWEGYPLEDVGIPDPDNPDYANGCKLVLTTRLHKVCQIMKCEAIQMDLLSREEAWSLFLDHVGHDVLRVKDLEPIVRDVASECARLPLAIATIATSMRGEKETGEWRVALAKLRAFSKDPDDKGKRVIEQLKFSYDRLENRKLQKCLLFCALYPEDYKMEREDLVELLALEGIIEEKESKRDEIDEGNAMLNNLINQCLLEGEKTSKPNPWVKMHDLVRDMALQIESQYLATSGIELRKLSHKKWTENLLKIHISNCYSLNVSPICPKLTTFILQDYSLENIPDKFFQHFKALKVLNLSGCHSLQVLPKSTSDLVNLVGLLFRDCFKLKWVPPLARLKDLRSLDFSMVPYRRFDLKSWNYSINVLEGLEELSNLRYLNLMSYPIKVFPIEILAKLFNLRHLVCSPFTEVSARELMCLKNLEIFMGVFPNIHELRVYVKYQEEERSQLTSYTFFVGVTTEYPHLYCNKSACGDNSFDKHIILANCNLGKPTTEKGMYLLPKDVQMLEITHVSDITSLCALVSLNYTMDLGIREIKNFSGVKELVSTSSSSSSALQSLRRLCLENLKNLEALIGRKKALSNVFPHLQELDISRCPKMKVMFNVGLLSNLNNLITLMVSDCLELEEIIGVSLDDDKDLNSTTADIILPKLRCLFFWKLPNLKSICPGIGRLICKSLNKINIEGCPNLEQSLYAHLDNMGNPSASLHRIEIKSQCSCSN